LKEIELGDPDSFSRLFVDDTFAFPSQTGTAMEYQSFRSGVSTASCAERSLREDA
jgi:hypothetical protein